MAKISQEKKLEALKDWLRENNLPFVENYESKFGVTMDVKITSLMIAVFVSNGDKEWERERFAATQDGKHLLYQTYNPFFIRPDDTKLFTLEKIRNCCYNRMLWLQKRYMKNMEEQAKKTKI